MSVWLAGTSRIVEKRLSQKLHSERFGLLSEHKILENVPQSQKSSTNGGGVFAKHFSLVLSLLILTSGCTAFKNWFGEIFGGEPATTGLAPVPTAIPRRPAGAITGRAFLATTSNLSKEQREQRILQEILRGNIPNFLRGLRSLSVSIDGRVITIYLTPDYLAIGDDSDFVRVAMNPKTAQAIADRFGFVLPTTRIVNLAYAKSEVRLSPAPLPPGPQMTTNAYFQRHEEMVSRQLGRYDRRKLVAGHKKDIVITNRLASRCGRVAIYGWHRSSNSPIQPLSLVHDDAYADYSHGVRLVYNLARLKTKSEEKWVRLADLLQDHRLARALSDEGPMVNLKAAVDCRVI
jgi:hypothetical protein